MKKTRGGSMTILTRTICGVCVFRIKGTRLVLIGDQVRFVVEIRNAKTGTLSFPDRETLSWKTIKKIPHVLCK